MFKIYNRIIKNQWKMMKFSNKTIEQKEKIVKKKFDWKKPTIFAILILSFPTGYYINRYENDFYYYNEVNEKYPFLKKILNKILTTKFEEPMFNINSKLNDNTIINIGLIFNLIDDYVFKNKNITRQDGVNLLINCGFNYPDIYNQFLSNSLLPNNNEKESDKITAKFLDLIGQKDGADAIRKVANRDKNEGNNDNIISPNSPLNIDEFLLLCEEIILNNNIKEDDFIKKLEIVKPELTPHSTYICGYDIVRNVYNYPKYNYMSMNDLKKKIEEHQSTPDIKKDKESNLEYLNDELEDLNFVFLLYIEQRKKEILSEIHNNEDKLYYKDDIDFINSEIKRVKNEISDIRGDKIIYSIIGATSLTIGGIIYYFFKN